MLRKLLIGLMVAIAYLAGVVTNEFVISTASGQQRSSRFVNIGADGPFRIWRDIQTDQCFIVTSPYFAMLSVGPC